MSYSYILTTMPCCEDCPEFEVSDNVTEVLIENTDPSGYFEDPYKKLITHRIGCVHDVRCRNMLKQLKEFNNGT